MRLADRHTTEIDWVLGLAYVITISICTNAVKMYLMFSVEDKTGDRRFGVRRRTPSTVCNYASRLTTKVFSGWRG